MSLGINLRVTGHSNQGGRKYMEDYFSVAYQASEIEKNDVEYAYFGIFDGHGGSEAAKFAKDHLLREIVNNKLFWSKYDSDVLRAIREGYISTHYAMWREQEKWPKTATGLPSTAGTTASVAFIFRKKIYIGHVGDSGIVLGYQDDGEKCWKAKPLTQDHKPECNVEKTRIINSGGKVVTKSGVPRVVWNRPRIGHKGPVRRSTPFDEIPFLAVARSLGDLWSYNSALNQFIVSPDPDVRVIKIDSKSFRCLIFGTDGLWNVVTPDQAVDMARDAEIVNERLIFMGGNNNEWTNPSKFLVEKALERWSMRRMRADNTSVITVFLDQPGQPKKGITGNNNGIIDRWSNTTRYELKYEMENEFNPEHIIYNRYDGITSNDVLSSCHSEDYYYEQYGTTTSSVMDREHILNSSGRENGGNEINNDCYSINSLQYSPQSSNNGAADCNAMNGFTIVEHYNTNCDTNYSYYESSMSLDNSSSNYKYDNTSSCDVIGTVDDSFIVHNNTAVMAPTSNISELESSFDLTHQLDETTIAAHQQNLDSIDPLTIPDNHQHTTNVEVHNDNSNYSHSFAESYNSLLISSLENDNSSSNSSSSSGCSNNSSSSNSNCSTSSNSDSSGDEEFYDGHHHSYKSLNETGLAGHDRVFHHSPNSSNEEQQEQYQKACMLREDGYSLTKLETRVEQRLRSNYQNNSNSINNNRGNDTCNNYNINNNNNNDNINNCNYNSNSISSKDNLQIVTNNKNSSNKNKNYINSNMNNINEDDNYSGNSNRNNSNLNNNKLNDISILNNNNISNKNNNDNNNNNDNDSNDDKNVSNKMGDNECYGDNNNSNNNIEIYSNNDSFNDADINNDNFVCEDLQRIQQTNHKQKETSIETFQTFTEVRSEINTYNQYNSITSSYSLNDDNKTNNFKSSNNYGNHVESKDINDSNLDAESISNHTNQILNITSNINFTSVESSDDINMKSVIEMETEVLDEEIEDIEMLNVENCRDEHLDSDKNTTEYLLEESIQINEISSSNIEINSPIPSPPSSNNFILEKLEIEPTNFSSIEMELEKSSTNLKTVTNNKLKNNNNNKNNDKNNNNNNKFNNNNFNKNNIKTKILKLNCKTSFPPDKQNENENMQTKSNTINYIRRSLRSSNNNNITINNNNIKKNNNNNRRNSNNNNNNSLSKDMKAKKILNKNKSSNNNLTKSIVAKEFLKIVDNSTNEIPKNTNTSIILAKLRSRPNNNNNSNNNNNDNNNNININIIQNNNISNNRISSNNKNNCNDSINSIPSQSSENLITREKVTVWSKRSRRIIQAINNNNNNSSNGKSNQKLNKALCTNNTANKNICNNNSSSSSVITSSSSSNSLNNNSNSKITTNFRFQNNNSSNSNHKIQHSISSVSSTTSSSLPSSTKTTTNYNISTKRSSTSRNSAWCPNKKSVQTRNRVQKR